MSHDNGKMNEGDRKAHVADSAQAFAQRRIGKREFLRRLAVAGVGLSSFAAAMLGGNRPFPATLGTRALADTGPSSGMTKWLRDVGGKYKGTKIRFVSEPTPPTLVASLLAKDEFVANTGIDVEIEICRWSRSCKRWPRTPKASSAPTTCSIWTSHGRRCSSATPSILATTTPQA